MLNNDIGGCHFHVFFASADIQSLATGNVQPFFFALKAKLCIMKPTKFKSATFVATEANAASNPFMPGDINTDVTQVISFIANGGEFLVEFEEEDSMSITAFDESIHIHPEEIDLMIRLLLTASERFHAMGLIPKTS